jgi:hypothetical protein
LHINDPVPDIRKGRLFEWSNGRFVASTWDSGKVEQNWKEKIIAQDAADALIGKLHIAQYSVNWVSRVVEPRN